MTIQQLRRAVLRMGLLAVASSTIASHTYAQADAESAQPIEGLKVKIKLSMRGIYDYPPYKAVKSFAPAAIPKRKDQGQQCFNFTSSGLGLDLEKEVPFAGDSVKGTVGIGLDKEKGVTLKKVYVDHKCFLVGLYATNLADIDAAPKTLTGDDPCSAIASSVAQIRWKHQLGEAFSFALGVEQAQELHLPKQKSWTLSHNLPAAGASVKYAQELGHVRLGGLLRVVDYNKVNVSEQKYAYTGGASLTSVLNVIPSMMTLKLHALYGQGIGKYTSDQVYDAYSNNASEIAAIRTMGGYVGLEQQWLPQLSSTVAYGILDAEDINKRHEEDYQQGQYASVNLMYQPIAQTTLGVEYQWGRRMSINKEDVRDAHRVQAAVSFKL